MILPESFVTHRLTFAVFQQPHQFVVRLALRAQLQRAEDGENAERRENHRFLGWLLSYHFFADVVRELQNVLRHQLGNPRIKVGIFFVGQHRRG